jgi:hypothetical protein
MFLVVYLVTSCLVGFLGGMRRVGFWGGFFASIAFTPLGGLVAVVALGPPYKKPSRKRGSHRVRDEQD